MEALLFDRPDEPLGIGVEIRALRRQPDRPRAYVASFQIPEAIIRVSPSGADIPATASPVTRTESTKLQVGYVGSL